MPKPNASERPGDVQSCKNCGARLSNQYCAVCGQRATVRIVSIWEVLRDVVDELFFLESRVWQTLGPLFFRPGLLTMDYLAGRRARYVPPVRLYIVLSVIFFVVVSLSGTVQIDTADPDVAQEVGDGGGTAEIDLARDSDGIVGVIDVDNDEIPDACTIDDGWTDSVPFGAEVREAMLASCDKIIADRGEAFRDALAEDIPLMMIVFIPLLALSMKILYPFSGRYYVEHLLFFVHFHAFGFLLLTLLTLSDELAESFTSLETVGTLLFSAGMIYLFVYLFIAMRRVYAQSRFATAVKYALLACCYVVFLALSFAGTAAYTALTL